MAENESFDFSELFPVADDDGVGLGGDDDDDKTCIDIQTIMKILDEDDCDTVMEERSPGDSSLKHASACDYGINDTFQLQNGSQLLEEPFFSGFDFMDSDMGSSTFCSDVSDSGTRGSVGLSDSAANSTIYCEHENQEPPSQDSSSPSAFPGSYRDSLSLGGNDEIYYTERIGVSKHEIPASSVETSFPEAYSNNISVGGNNLKQSMWKGENDSQFKHVGEDVASENASHSSIIENGDVSFEDYLKHTVGGVAGNQENDSCTSFDISAGRSLQVVSSIIENGDVSIEDFVKGTIGGVSGHQENDSCTSFEIPVMNDDRSLRVATSTDSNVLSDVSNYYLSSDCYQETDDSPIFDDSSLAVLSNGIYSRLWTNKEAMSNMKAENAEFYGDMSCASSSMPSSATGAPSFHDSQFMITDSEFPSVFPDNVMFEDKASAPLSTCASYTSYGDQSLCVRDDAKFNVGQDMKQLRGAFPSMGYQSYECFKPKNNFTVSTSSMANHKQDIFDGTARKFQGHMGNMDLKVMDKSLPYPCSAIASDKQFRCVKREGGGKMVQHKRIDSHLSKGSFENIHAEDDFDICIIEDISHPAPPRQSADFGNSLNISHASRYVDSRPCMVGSTRPKACDERNILRVALQDLSQPKSEVSPPDGLLAVPLLRHQRIALSWMIQKETSSLHCSGGILADDQGLGKTVSTISLILKEKRPMLSVCPNAPQAEAETLNLDADDGMLPLNDGVKKECRYPVQSMNLLTQAKGRPSAGTLIVCPTSVLRQWAEELHNKVTSQANLSVLVYHGGNRTKDPYEVAKYDVVLTTYSIVGSEVPKQPLVDKDEEKGDFEDRAVLSRKRKEPSNSNRKGKKLMGSTVLEAIAGPLAKVAWFRVVLDEAQSIKNYKTLAARACWGLRAKRRWCLSGTPIQNSIDDLYSYFRFLRYDPYAVHSSFCSMIKNPINRNPTNGYRKLQAVLKTIMLRRTKGTLLDGEPIISLPPKFVELKKVDFSREERDFYSKLEADSRAQFQEYANAGTVKQNYVNILLMLLRLRQACDHPLLVKRYNSDSLWKSSVETAKKIPQETLTSLLKCLESSLALCGICNDSPEDAVVSVCGHVFCNQCICEHLAGDDNQCPATNCKTGLKMSSVFSKVTLSSCLSEQGCDNSPDCSGSEVEESGPWSQSQPYNSSKIKAALEMLQSLCKPQCYASKNIFAHSTSGGKNDCPLSSSDSNKGKSFKNSPENQNLYRNRSSNDSVTGVGEKAIVFSQWTRMLDLLEECLKKSSIQYRRLDGTMSVVARDKAVKDFNTLPEVSVVIMSLKAASLGLNMVAACRVLMLDLWWNPTTEDQAIDRAHRIGQTRPVTVLRLTVRDTVEDRILALQEKKRKMVASAFGEDGTGDHQSRLTVDDLKYLFMM
ncbi:hypothetical protein RIF29_35960 [Crotalaria pallida]|uniref:Helicase-like transcription factor CHR28 n=1 Tax=Crotalaria pallida TaxID=3830 RepID=A0AAN9EBQ7_CROPI